jgi:hypothetical protein
MGTILGDISSAIKKTGLQTAITEITIPKEAATPPSKRYLNPREGFFAADNSPLIAVSAKSSLGLMCGFMINSK